MAKGEGSFHKRPVKYKGIKDGGLTRINPGGNKGWKPKKERNRKGR